MKRTSSGVDSSPLPLDPTQTNALSAIICGRQVAVLGPAGTGKSHLLRTVVEELRNLNKRVAVTSSTGISAVQVGGTTIHQFFGLADTFLRGSAGAYGAMIRDGRRGPGIKERVQETDTLFIDEVSMVSAFMLDFLDDALRAARANSSPFGGLQVVVLGDFAQLKPVASRNFPDPAAAMPAFKARSWSTFSVFRLTRLHRQAGDRAFAFLLKRLRKNALTEEDVENLRERIDAPFPDDGIAPSVLVGHRATADKQNTTALRRLEGPSTIYRASIQVIPKAGLSGKRARDVTEKGSAFLKRSMMAPPTLELRVGALVMLLANLDVEGGLANGTLGVVTELDPDAPTVRFTNGVTRVITPHSFPSIDAARTGNDWSGTYTQVPLNLAWATTVHKSQGMTLSRVVITCDRRNMFGDHMAYVAFSRARTLDSIRLEAFDEGAIKVCSECAQYF